VFKKEKNNPLKGISQQERGVRTLQTPRLVKKEGEEVL